MRGWRDGFVTRIIKSLNNNGGASEPLCTACGLCCDGTLFGQVPLTTGDEVPELENEGISIEFEAERRIFKQPCAAYRRKLCSVYAYRPRVCRTFECKLLKKYLSAEI